MRYLEAKARQGPSQNKLAVPDVDTNEPEAPTPAAEVPEVDATDAARDLASEHGIALADVTGSGSGGRITVADVRALIEGAE